MTASGKDGTVSNASGFEAVEPVERRLLVALVHVRDEDATRAEEARRDLRPEAGERVEVHAQHARAPVRAIAGGHAARGDGRHGPGRAMGQRVQPPPERARAEALHLEVEGHHRVLRGNVNRPVLHEGTEGLASLRPAPLLPGRRRRCLDLLQNGAEGSVELPRGHAQLAPAVELDARAHAHARSERGLEGEAVHVRRRSRERVDSVSLRGAVQSGAAREHEREGDRAEGIPSHPENLRPTEARAMRARETAMLLQVDGRGVKFGNECACGRG